MTKREQKLRPEYTFMVRVKSRGGRWPASRERIRALLEHFLTDGFEESEVIEVLGVGHCGKTHQANEVMEP